MFPYLMSTVQTHRHNRCEICFMVEEAPAQNIINYPAVSHQMASVLSEVPDREAFVVSIYVCGCILVCAFCVSDVFVYSKQNKSLLLVFSLV